MSRLPIVGALKYLFLSTLDAVDNLEALKEQGITHVMLCGEEKEEEEAEEVEGDEKKEEEPEAKKEEEESDKEDDDEEEDEEDAKFEITTEERDVRFFFVFLVLVVG